jgi:hypothetical protein
MTFYDDVFETTDEFGDTLIVSLRPEWSGGVVITVRDETTAAITLSTEQTKALANALVDAGF